MNEAAHCAGVRAVTEAALAEGIEAAMKDIQGQEAWTSWMQLISGAWSQDAHAQAGWVRACILQARQAVEEHAATDRLTSEAANDLLNGLERWDRDVAATTQVRAGQTFAR